MLAETMRVSKPGARFLFTSSPKTLTNTLRRLLGAKLFLRSDEEIIALLTSAHFQIGRRSRAFMQSQWFVCKAESTLAFLGVNGYIGGQKLDARRWLLVANSIEQQAFSDKQQASSIK